jgi:hypothetical protein
MPLTLFNTGLDANRAPLQGGSVDPHYTLIQSAATAAPGPNAVVASQIADDFWLANTNASQWLAPTADQSLGGLPCNQAGTYVYRTQFDLSNLDPATAIIQGGWATDDLGSTILLNGAQVYQGTGSYDVFSPFTINAGFVPGVNTLDFVVEDQGCPGGIRIELTGSAQPSASIPG